jgi:hypothetical protein
LTANTLFDKGLVYEEMDDKVIPYKNFHKVLLQQATIEDIMGSSQAQAIVISVILRFLYTHLPKEKYLIVTNEAGLHLKKNNNLAADIAIFDRSKVTPDVKNTNYFGDNPKVVIEVDIKADLSDFASPQDYYRLKSRKLLDWGVEKVIWISTVAETVMFDDTLSHQSWHIPFAILDNLVIHLGKEVEHI